MAASSINIVIFCYFILLLSLLCLILISKLLYSPATRNCFHNKHSCRCMVIYHRGYYCVVRIPITHKFKNYILIRSDECKILLSLIHFVSDLRQVNIYHRHYNWPLLYNYLIEQFRCFVSFILRLVINFSIMCPNIQKGNQKRTILWQKE